MEFVKIVTFSMFAAIAYGILHDQVTAHLCVEHFTIAHPTVFPTQSPFWLALGWGIIATWWVGLPLGVLLAAVVRWGSPPRLSFSDVRPLILALLAAMALCAIVAGTLGYYLVAVGNAQVPDHWGPLIPQAKWAVFTADAWAHFASYLTGEIGGLLVVCYAIWLRIRRSGAAFWGVFGREAQRAHCVVYAPASTP